jgi:hypothetical protein
MRLLSQAEALEELVAMLDAARSDALIDLWYRTLYA